MAYVAGNRNTTLNLGHRLGEIINGFSTAYADWRVYRDTLNELRLLSDRELDDLGLNRSMIDAVAQDAAYGKRA